VAHSIPVARISSIYIYPYLHTTGFLQRYQIKYRDFSVSSFVSYWDMITDESDSLILYHLVFSPDTGLIPEKNMDTIRDHRRAVQLNYILLYPKGRESTDTIHIISDIIPHLLGSSL
jgi:hypothetical protein